MTGGSDHDVSRARSGGGLPGALASVAVLCDRERRVARAHREPEVAPAAPLLRRGGLTPLRADHRAAGVLPDPHRTRDLRGVRRGHRRQGDERGRPRPAHPPGRRRARSRHGVQDGDPPARAPRAAIERRLRAHRRLARRARRGRFQAEGLAPRAARAAPGHDERTGAARSAGDCRAAARPVHRELHRQPHQPRGRSIASRRAPRARPADRPLAGHGPAQVPVRLAPGLRRRRRDHRRLQQERPGPHQSRAGRALRPRALPPRRALERGGVPD